MSAGNLALQGVSKYQAGNYTCIASNVEGDGESNVVELRVMCKYLLFSCSVCQRNQRKFKISFPAIKTKLYRKLNQNYQHDHKNHNFLATSLLQCWLQFLKMHKKPSIKHFQHITLPILIRLPLKGIKNISHKCTFLVPHFLRATLDIGQTLETFKHCTLAAKRSFQLLSMAGTTY